MATLQESIQLFYCFWWYLAFFASNFPQWFFNLFTCKYYVKRVWLAFSVHIFGLCSYCVLFNALEQWTKSFVHVQMQLW